MAFDKTNTGTIAKNTRKETEKHPDITGSLNVEGREFYINGWQKTNGQDGTKFYSLSVKPKEARQETPGISARSYPADKASRHVPTAFEPTGYSPADEDSDPIPF
jgi:hypothetical protein